MGNARSLSYVHIYPQRLCLNMVECSESRLRTRNQVEFFSTVLPTIYKGLMEKTYTWIEAREVATNGASNDHREGSDSLSKSPREILATKKILKTFKQPPRMLRNRWSHDMTKYCHFHEDHRHDTNDCRELRHQIEEDVKSGQLSHLVKGIKKGKVKALNTQQDDWKKGSRDTAPVEAPMLMIIRKDHTLKKSQWKNILMDLEKSHFHLSHVSTTPPIQSLRVDSKVPLVSFSREHSWPIGEVPLEVTIGIPRTIMVGGKPFNTEHKLNGYKHIKHVKQKKCALGPDCSKVAYKEVEELMKAGILQRAKNQTWVANPVMVKKSDGGWRMCVDFTDIDKACPKD
ncbi:hypothetical protein Tco_0551981 [Tanacetum coccineum]